jgi:hypothetical protein
VEDIHSADHCWLAHQWKGIYCPGDPTNLSIDLDEDFVDDGSQILASLDSAGQDYLGGDSKLGQEESLDFIVGAAPTLGAWQQKHYCLDAWVEPLPQLFLPVFSIHGSLDLEDRRSSVLVAKLLKALLHS